MLNKKFHVVFSVIVIIIFALLATIVHAENITAVPQRDGTVIMTKHDFIQLQKYIQALQAESKHINQKAEYWENRYAVVEECVRENIKQNKLVMICFNDLEL